MIYHIVWTQHVAYMQMTVFYTGVLIHFMTLLSYKEIYCSLNTGQSNARCYLILINVQY